MLHYVKGSKYYVVGWLDFKTETPETGTGTVENIPNSILYANFKLCLTLKEALQHMNPSLNHRESVILVSGVFVIQQQIKTNR